MTEAEHKIMQDAFRLVRDFGEPPAGQLTIEGQEWWNKYHTQVVLLCKQYNDHALMREMVIAVTNYLDRKVRANGKAV